MAKSIIIAVDAKQRTLDALALGHLLSDATGAPAVLISVFAYHPLGDPGSPELEDVRDEARQTLLELAQAEGIAPAEARVVAGNFAARELQHATEQPDAGIIVVGSTTRGAVGRLLPGGVGERLLAGAACPVAIAPRDYADRRPERLSRIGVGIDDDDEAREALDAAITLAAGAGARLQVITAVARRPLGAAGAAALRAAHGDAVGEARARVEVEDRLVDGPADDVLAAHSADLDLLVVGSRGYGPVGAVLLGGTSGQLAHTARCPLLVMPRGTRLHLGT
ncbi:MAG TPA: universal stress protein [Solirubrobacteraceae bacterium]|nr:universal stress protein [Solirubrobacteraceae bacterium]